MICQNKICLIFLVLACLKFTTGKSISKDLNEEIERNKRQAQAQAAPDITEDSINDEGVEEIAQRYFGSFPTFTQFDEAVTPIRSVASALAPPRQGEEGFVPLPLAMHAVIRRNHLIPRTNIPSHVRENVIALDALPGDERGHLLAASLEGQSHVYNVVPQTMALNRGRGSAWYRTEDQIRDRFQNNDVDRVEWTAVVVYGNVQTNRRPTGFGVRYRSIRNDGTELFDSGNLYFSNA